MRTDCRYLSFGGNCLQGAEYVLRITPGFVKMERMHGALGWYSPERFVRHGCAWIHCNWYYVSDNEDRVNTMVSSDEYIHIDSDNSEWLHYKAIALNSFIKAIQTGVLLWHIYYGRQEKKVTLLIKNMGGNRIWINGT